MSRVAELGPVCRQTAFLRYGSLGAALNASHLQQVSGGFSSCESHNLNLDWDLLGRLQLRPESGLRSVATSGEERRLRADPGRFVLKRITPPA
jgi:hypothetical protein